MTPTNAQVRREATIVVCLFLAGIALLIAPLEVIHLQSTDQDREVMKALIYKYFVLWPGSIGTALSCAVIAAYGRTIWRGGAFPLSMSIAMICLQAATAPVVYLFGILAFPPLLAIKFGVLPYLFYRILLYYIRRNTDAFDFGTSYFMHKVFLFSIFLVPSLIADVPMAIYIGRYTTFP